MQLKIKRATTAQLDTAASSNLLRVAELYLITDIPALAIGTSDSTYKLVSGGSSTIVGRVYYAGAPYTLVSGAPPVKVPYDTVVYDTGSIWDAVNTYWKPTIAGYYRINGSVQISNTQILRLYVTKNGTNHSGGMNQSTTGYCERIEDILYMNGTTDYVEIWASLQITRDITNNSFYTTMDIEYIGA